jgi:hypothetical protein
MTRSAKERSIWKVEQVTVVDADHVRVVAQRALEFGFIVHFEKRVEAGEPGRAMDRTDFIVGQATHDDKDAARSRLGGFEHLVGVHHEVLADAGQALPAWADLGRLGSGP